MMRLSLSRAVAGDRLDSLIGWLATLVFAAVAGFSSSASAAPTCPPALFVSGGCNIDITINPDSSVSLTVGPLGLSSIYDLSDDSLIGVYNLSPNTVSAINLTGAGIFGFDEDGPPWQGAPFGPTGYEGPGTSFSVQDVNRGTVLFTSGLAPGGFIYFALEEAPASVFATLSAELAPVPAPGTFALVIASLLGLGAAARMNRRSADSVRPR